MEKGETVRKRKGWKRGILGRQSLPSIYDIGWHWKKGEKGSREGKEGKKGKDEKKGNLGFLLSWFVPRSKPTKCI